LDYSTNFIRQRVSVQRCNNLYIDYARVVTVSATNTPTLSIELLSSPNMTA
jgi:hypothetical protein